MKVILHICNGMTSGAAINLKEQTPGTPGSSLFFFDCLHFVRVRRDALEKISRRKESKVEYLVVR